MPKLCGWSLILYDYLIILGVSTPTRYEFTLAFQILPVCLWNDLSNFKICDDVCVGPYEITYQTFPKIFIQVTPSHSCTFPPGGQSGDLWFSPAYMYRLTFYCLIDPSYFHPTRPLGHRLGTPTIAKDFGGGDKNFFSPKHNAYCLDFVDL